jgi:dihydroorotase (multifunctional complex type)
MQTFVLKNGIAALDSGCQAIDVIVEDGVIAGVGPQIGLSAPGAVTYDVTGKYVLPGIIDPHVHLREFEHSDREDFYTGTQSAAVGGITTVFDMPNSKPNVITADDFKARRDRVMERAYVNIGLYVWACSKNVDFLEKFSPLGAIAFKIFTAETGAYDPAFAQYITSEPDAMFRILERTGPLDMLTAIHSESYSLIRHLEQYAKAHMPADISAYLHSRPPLVEDVAVFSEVAIAKHCKARIHICHVVGKGSLQFIRWAKQGYNPQISCECTPHNLLMTDAQTIGYGSLGKFSPPVHGEEHRRELWQGLVDGTVDMVGSDHAPQNNQSKKKTNVWEAPPGSPALDYWVPLMLDRVAAGEMSMERFVEVTSKRPAQVFGLYPRKGSIRVGADADLVVIDMAKTSRVDPTRFKSKAKYTPFTDWPLRGLPVMTFVRGTLVARDGEIVANAGCGEFVIPDAELHATTVDTHSAAAQ